DVIPAARWQLLGPITAMNGVLLFGWSTAVTFEVFAKQWHVPRRRMSNKHRRKTGPALTYYLRLRGLRRQKELSSLTYVKGHIFRAVIFFLLLFFFRLAIFWISLGSTAQCAEQVTAPARVL